MLSAKLRLNAITLRGIGPYVHGARLEIKPLTILCGENGSGKSTWIEVLRMMQNAIGMPPNSEEGRSMNSSWRLPFSMEEPNKRESNWLKACYRCELNSHVYYAGDSDASDWCKEKEYRRVTEKIAVARKALENLDDVKFGPWGCLGFEITTIGTFKCSVMEIDESLLRGRPTSVPEKLLWNGELPQNLQIRIRCAAPQLTAFDNEDWPRFTGLCELLELGIFDDEVNEDVKEKEPKKPKYILQLQRRMDKRLLSNGEFENIEDEFGLRCSKIFLFGHSPDETNVIKLGTVKRSFPWPEDVTKDTESVDIPDEVNKTLLNNTLNLIHRIVGDVLNGFFPIGAVRTTLDEDATELAKVMFPSDTSEPQETGPIENTKVYNDVRPDLRRVEHDFSLERRNHVQELFAWWAYNLMAQPGESPVPACGHEYVFETFVNSWLTKLTGASLEWVGKSRKWSTWEDNKHFPNGGLVDDEQNWAPPNELAELRYQNRGNFVEKAGFRDMGNVIRTPMANGHIGWHVMSTGFHQLAPIVVQAGLLHRNEIMAVENPEAHLHPSSQIKFAEFLMHQANAGKIMLIETHSDLLVRRIMRAIIEEDVTILRNPQEAVAIHFTRVKHDEDKTRKYATVEKLKVDENGRIVWPPDFMDDYVKESRRLLDAMYGTPTEESDNDDT